MQGLEQGAALPDVLGRYLAADERGVGLRATWRPAAGFVNLSLWRDLTCVATFHLTPQQASELISFLAQSLASVAPQPTRPSLRLVDRFPATGSRGGTATRDVVQTARRRIASHLAALAERLRR